MKKLKLLMLCLVGISAIAKAQSAKEILENSKKLKDGTVLLLKYQNGELRYSNKKKPTSFIPLNDSLYFITREDAVNVYIGTLNPLNNTISQDITFTTDMIDKAEDEALKEITSLLEKIGKQKAMEEKKLKAAQDAKNEAFKLSNNNVNKAAKTKAANKVNTVATENKEFQAIRDAINNLNNALIADKQENIVRLFNTFKTLTYNDKTYNLLEAAHKEMIDIEKNLKVYDDSVSSMNKLIEKYKEDEPEDYAVKFVFNETVKKLEDIITNKKVRFSNLQKAYDLVNNAQLESQVVPGFTSVGTVGLTRGKVAHMTVYLNDEGLKLDTDNEIITSDKKVLITKTINVRKHQTFVPEVVAGIAYTFLNFPKYGTGTDAAGNTIVADGGTENFKRLSITAMINYNYFVPGSNLIPFFQIGVGAKSDYPTLLTGVGVRIAGALGRRLAISGGFASTWVDTLNKLKIGDKIAGTAELEADITHDLKFPLRPYLGVQISF